LFVKIAGLVMITGTTLKEGTSLMDIFNWLLIAIAVVIFLAVRGKQKRKKGHYRPSPTQKPGDAANLLI